MTVSFHTLCQPYKATARACALSSNSILFSCEFLLQRFSENLIAFVADLRVDVPVVLVCHSQWYCLRFTPFVGYYTEMHRLSLPKLQTLLWFSTVGAVTTACMFM